MFNRSNIVFAALGFFLLGACFNAQAAAIAPAKEPSATQPAVKNPERHQQFLETARRGNIDVLFLGDSITDSWRNTGKSVWDKTFGTLHAANFGISADRTQHLLWRIQNGELEGFKAKVIVMMIGTNNIQRNDNPEVVAGISLLVKEIRSRQPEAHLVLLGIFPRDSSPSSTYRTRIKEVNSAISALDDGKHVFYRDIGASFLAPDGFLPEEIMPDALHPSEKGYQIWADAILPTVKEMLNAN